MKKILVDALQSSKAPIVFREIASGLPRPPLTDYRLQPIPEEWDPVVPPDLVAGNQIVPFAWDHSYAIFCIDTKTSQILLIDFEEPWPPTRTFETWQSFAADLVQQFVENEPESVAAVRDLLSETT